MHLHGQTVVVIGGGAGIGRETARRARAEGADVIVTGHTALKPVFDGLPGPVDNIVVTAGDDILLALDVARNAAAKMRPGGILMLLGDDAPFAAALAVAMAPIRVRVALIAPVAAFAVEMLANAAPPAPRARGQQAGAACDDCTDVDAQAEWATRARAASSQRPDTSRREAHEMGARTRQGGHRGRA
jgi:hypothetical protein